MADREPNQQLNAAEEAFVHTAAGFEQPGKPFAVHPSDAPTAMLHVRIVDASSDQLTAARVNIVGPQGNFYEPRQNGLTAWSRQQTARNETHGPSRFYTLGDFHSQVPVGPLRTEVWKGYEC